MGDSMVTVPRPAVNERGLGNRRGQETRQRVLSVAAELFAANGYHGTGMSELGRAAKLGRGALYHHISTKEELLFEITMAPLAALLAVGEAIEESPRGPEDKLRALSRTLLEDIAASLPAYTVSMREMRSLSGARAQALIDARNAYEAVWRRVMEDGVRQRVFRAADPVTVRALLGMHNYSYLWLRPDGPRTPAQLSELLSDIALNGISEAPFDGKKLKASDLPPLPRPVAEAGTRERILQVATELFAEHGYHGTGMAQLSDATGLGSGALYYHIVSKEDLLYEISSRHVGAMIEYGEAVLETDLPPAQKLHAISRGLVTTIAERKAEVTVFFREVRSLQGQRYEQLLALRDRYEHIWMSVLKQGVAAGQFRRADRLTVKALLGLHNYSYLWLDQRGEVAPRTVADRFTRLALKGVGR